jgi:hypothetical protein
MVLVAADLEDLVAGHLGDEAALHHADPAVGSLDLDRLIGHRSLHPTCWSILEGP